MKKVVALCGAVCIFLSSYAQREETESSKGFNPNNVFVGASLALGFGSGVFNVGGNPEVGYTLTNWLDAGISTNINYSSLKASYNNGYRQRSTVYGGGPFLRVFPIHNVFIQVLPEYNWIHSNIKDMYNGSEYKMKDDAISMLAGIGYGTRIIGRSGFFTSIMFDLGNNSNSPYVSYYQDNYGNWNKSKVPVIRTGFNIYLGQKRR